MSEALGEFKQLAQRLEVALDAARGRGIWLNHGAVIGVIGVCVGLVGLTVGIVSFYGYSSLQRDVDKLQQRQDLHQVYIEDLTRRTSK